MNTGVLTAFVTDPAYAADAARPAVSLEDAESWSYAELHEMANRYANVLAELGVVGGDRVGMLLFNSLEYWALYLAITRLGAIAVRINFRLSAAELRYVLGDAGCAVVCFHDELAAVVDQIRDEIPARSFVCFSHASTPPPSWAQPESFMVDASSAEPAVGAPGEHDAAMLMYTSGTTGRPKGAVWTHANTLWFGAMQAMLWKYDASTVAMTSGPLYHVGAFEDLLVPALMMRGQAVITRSRGFSITRLARALSSRNVTDALVYPFMIYDLLQEPELRELELPRLRRLVTGGSAIVAWAVNALSERFPNVELIQTYGLTEGGGIATATPDGEVMSRPDSVGRALPLTELRVVGDDGEQVGPGQAGEVLVRSPSVASRYWGKPAESAETFVEGWCRTGDLGVVSRGGDLTITGRKKDMIKSGGENIYPVEIEMVLAEHPGIQEAAVIGVPDPTYIEAVCAVVVPRRNASVTAEEVVAHCRERLAGYKKPRYVVCVDTLPKTASGKVQKFLLRQQYAAIGKKP